MLHALGDAVAPHHGIAATGWRHRPFEDFAGFAWKEMFSEGGSNHYFSMQLSLEQAYKWWRFLDDSQMRDPNQLPVRELITSLAYETRGVSDFAIKNGISLGYSDGDESAAREEYESDEDRVKSLLESGTGATLAFLVKAAQFAVPGPNPSPCTCAAGSARNVDESDPSACTPCAVINQVEVDGQCAPSCPADKPLREPSGRCVASCPAGNCTGVACPNATDFVENGACVAQCSAAAPVVVRRECRESCPPEMVATDTTPQFCQTEPHCRTTTGTRDNNGICDEHCAPGLDFIANRTCVAECPSTERFFVIEAELGCLAECPDGRPMSVVTSGPTECLRSCPSTAPYSVFGQRDCMTQCPATAPFHTQYSECVSQCPYEAPYFVRADGLCRETCPPGYHWSESYECFPDVQPPR